LEDARVAAGAVAAARLLARAHAPALGEPPRLEAPLDADGVVRTGVRVAADHRAIATGLGEVAEAVAVHRAVDGVVAAVADDGSAGREPERGRGRDGGEEEEGANGRAHGASIWDGPPPRQRRPA